LIQITAATFARRDKRCGRRPVMPLELSIILVLTAAILLGSIVGLAVMWVLSSPSRGSAAGQRPSETTATAAVRPDRHLAA
jgi:hypothetical protein